MSVECLFVYVKVLVSIHLNVHAYNSKTYSMVYSEGDFRLLRITKSKDYFPIANAEHDACSWTPKTLIW